MALSAAGDGQVLPKSATGEAVRYALKQWQPLSVFGGRPVTVSQQRHRATPSSSDGRPEELVVHRRQSVGSTVDADRQRAPPPALTVGLPDVVLRRLVGGEVKLETLLPDVGAEAHPKSIRTYRQTEPPGRAAETKARGARRRKLAKVAKR